MQFARHGDQTVCLALEVILNHNYASSRFLRGASLQWDQIDVDVDDATATADANPSAPAPGTDTTPLRYLHPQRSDIHVLDKVLSFDDTQQAVFDTPAPLVLVGSAGSGKTALTLEKLRQARGRVLYVTQSAFLAQSAQAIYFAHGFEADGQEPEFLSYREFVAGGPTQPLAARLRACRCQSRYVGSIDPVSADRGALQTPGRVAVASCAGRSRNCAATQSAIRAITVVRWLVPCESTMKWSWSGYSQ